MGTFLMSDAIQNTSSHKSSAACQKVSRRLWVYGPLLEDAIGVSSESRRSIVLSTRVFPCLAVSSFRVERKISPTRHMVRRGAVTQTSSTGDSITIFTTYNIKEFVRR